MLIGSQTMAIWATHFLPAGVAAVFGSAAPVFLALIAWAFLREPLARTQLAGVALGLVGLAAMAWASSSVAGFRPAGAVMALTASATWAAGSLAAPRLRLPADAMIGLAAQLLPTAFLLGLAAWLTGIGGRSHPTSMPPRAWAALAFLVVASTLVGYATFLALSRSVSPVLANSFNYASPVIALGLSDLLLDEPVGRGKLIGAGLTLAGVALMVSGVRPGGDRAGTPGDGEDAKHGVHTG